MFKKTINDIFTIDSLKYVLKLINPNSMGIDKVSIEDFICNLDKNLNELLKQLLSNTYIPEPVKKIEIIKEKKNRVISICSIRDKIVQKILSIELLEYFDKIFSDKSYAYRLNKSHIRAINRTTNFINEKNTWIFKTDIKNFFDNINHQILIEKLKKHILDENIINLIHLFLKNGGFNNYDYIENIEGVNQGDIISPLLSNIYLDEMDKYLESKEINFVRFADDFIILAKNNFNLEEIKKNLISFLNKINLSLNNEKTYISNINKGFEFLGVLFKNNEKFIENNRLQRIQSKIYSFSRISSSLEDFVSLINDYTKKLENYYFKIIKKDSKQFKVLEETINESIFRKIKILKESKLLSSKKELFDSIKKIYFFTFFSTKDFDKIISSIINNAILSDKKISQVKTSNPKINKKVNSYSKNFSNLSTLHISEFGLFLGISKNQFVVKKSGKVIKSFPQNLIKRIVINNKGTTISTDVIQMCCQKNIPLDFIDLNYNPYASIVTYNASISQNAQKQLSLLNTSKQFDLSLAFIKGKTKNQINYIKYLSKYHINLKENIELMEKNFNLMEEKNIQINQLMGY